MHHKHKFDRLFSKKVKSRLELYALILNILFLITTILSSVSVHH